MPQRARRRSTTTAGWSIRSRGWRALVSFHGLVGRIAPLASMAEEEEWLAQSLADVCEHARRRDVRIVYEVLNRYESHLVNTGRAALALIERVGADNLGVLLDAYHMNIEEAAPAAAIRAVGDRLGLFHVADSNREGIGRGHTDSPPSPGRSTRSATRGR